MKHTYLEFKNKYTLDQKYLAVINENGLWIKDKLNDKIMILHAENIDKNFLKNIVITVYDSEFRNQRNIIAPEANISNKIWKIKNAIEVDNVGKKETKDILEFETNFDYLKINSLFSNLESLNIFQLVEQKNDFEAVGLSVLDIKVHLVDFVFLQLWILILQFHNFLSSKFFLTLSSFLLFLRFLFSK